MMRKGLCNRIRALLPLLGIISLVAMTGTAQGLELQGHRGARGLMPENTLPAFAKALSIGVDTLELDVGMTRDGVIVVLHDSNLKPELARTPDGNWLTKLGPVINSLTLQQLKSYDVGRINPQMKYASRFPDQQTVDGTQIPTLAEVFELVNKSGNVHVQFNIETKINPNKPALSPSPKTFSQAVLKVVDHFNMNNRTTIQSFDWRTVQEVQRLAPSIKTSYLTASQRWLDTLQVGQSGASPWMGGFDVDSYEGSAPKAIRAAGGTIWSPYHREVSAASLKTAHDLGLQVMVWTVNKPARMNELIDMGVDGIITDYPNVLRDILIKRDIKVALPTPMNLPPRR